MQPETQSIDLSRLGVNGGVSGRLTSKTCADDRYRLGASIAEVAYSGQNVVLCAFFTGFRLWAARLPATAKVDGQHTKSGV